MNNGEVREPWFDLRRHFRRYITCALIGALLVCGGIWVKNDYQVARIASIQAYWDNLEGTELVPGTTYELDVDSRVTRIDDTSATITMYVGRVEIYKGISFGEYLLDRLDIN